MAPLGVGMMCTYPLTGCLTDRFGIRRLTRYGAICSGLRTLILAVLACTGFNTFVLATALFLRGGGTGVIGIPALSAG